MTEQFQEKSGDKYTCGVIYTVSSSDIALSSLDVGASVPKTARGTPTKFELKGLEGRSCSHSYIVIFLNPSSPIHTQAYHHLPL